MRNGKLELAEFGPLGYVFASQKAKAEPLASFADGTGKLTSYTAGIWVSKDSPARKIEDLADLAVLRGVELVLGRRRRLAVDLGGVDLGFGQREHRFGVATGVVELHVRDADLPRGAASRCCGRPGVCVRAQAASSA
ncbi:hypothetical protein UK23_18765, partial [Lentzea aerocolonigenes]